MVLLGANLVLLVAFQAIRGESSYDSLYGWVANLSMLVPTAACFARAISPGPRRAAAIWLGLGMLSYTVGNIIFVGWTQFQDDPPVPSPADLAYLGFCPFVLAGIVALVRREHTAPAEALWLDGALGAAGPRRRWLPS